MAYFNLIYFYYANPEMNPLNFLTKKGKNMMNKFAFDRFFVLYRPACQKASPALIGSPVSESVFTHTSY